MYTGNSLWWNDTSTVRWKGCFQKKIEIPLGWPGWKKAQFQPGLKLKSEVDPSRNFTVSFVILAIRMVLHVFFIFSARSTGQLKPDWSFSPDLKLSLCNCELRFLKYFIGKPRWNLISVNRAWISVRAESLRVIGLIRYQSQNCSHNEVCVRNSP